MLTFGDAIKMVKPVSFCTLVKPVGSMCNLKCSYCYYLDKELQYGTEPRLMDDGLLDKYVRQFIEANDVPQVDFYWHGGEPLVAGLEFFEKAISLQNKYKGAKKITNTIQTNGTLIDNHWARFFSRNNFLVGISIDGSRSLHDRTRFTRGGKTTFDDVMCGLECLKKYKVEFNTLTTVNSFSEGHGTETYRFLKNIGSRYMQFLPVTECMNNKGIIVGPESPEPKYRTELSVSAQGYGQFLIDVFNEWVISDVGSYYVQIFDATLANLYGVTPGICTACETCGEALTVEHNGDVYPCDHFVYPEYKLGNIRTDTLSDMFKSEKRFTFGCSKRNALHDDCHQCKWLGLCWGGCPKHRFEKSRYALCEGMKMFFQHTEPYMEYMCKSIENGHAASDVMSFARKNLIR